MANSTDPFAESIHGTNPQNLVEKITRLKIYNSVYWKEECFGLTAETIIDKAVSMKYFGGSYGGNLKPTKFLCLILKMLQLQPEKDIVVEFIKNEDFKYIRILGAFYLRLAGKPEDVYKYLEPLYNDYRKIVFRGKQGWEIRHIDELIDELLHEELVCDIALPYIPSRLKLEETGVLEPRRSALEDDIDDDDEDDEMEWIRQDDGKIVIESGKVKKRDNEPGSDIDGYLLDSRSKNRYDDVRKEHIAETISDARRKVRSSNSPSRPREDSSGRSRRKEPDNDRSRGSSRGRYPKETRYDGDRRRERRDSPTRSRSRSSSRDRHRRDRSRDRGLEYDRGRRDRRSRDGERERSHKKRSSFRSDRDRDRERSDMDRDRERSDRDRDWERSDRDRDRERRDRDRDWERSDRDRERSDKDRDRESSRRKRSSDRRDSRDRDRARGRSSDRPRRRDSRDRDRREARSARSRSSSRSSSASSSSSSSSSSGSVSNSDRSADRSRTRVDSGRPVEHGRSNESGNDDELQNSSERATPVEAETTVKSKKTSTKKFEKMFGKKSSAATGPSESADKKKAPEGSVEYWNDVRAALGLNKLK